MKKLLLFASTLFGALTIQAQSSLTLIDYNNGQAIVPNNSVLQYTTAIDDITTMDMDAQNTTTVSNTYRIRRTDVSLNPGSSAYICIDGVTCYPASVYHPTVTVTLAPGQKLSDIGRMFLLHYDEVPSSYTVSTPAAAFSSIKYEIYNVNNASDVLTFRFNYNDDFTSVKESSSLFSSISNVFPNPAINKASINVTTSSELNNVSISIVNSLGSVVSNKNTHLMPGKNTINIETESLPSGIYFATISTGNTKTVKKFTINK